MDRTKNLVDIQTIVNTSVAQNIPTVLIDQNIGWLKRIKNDAEFTIGQLEHVKNSRKRAKDYRDKMQATADLFLDDEDLLDKNSKIRVIIQRLGCDKKRAYEIYDIILRRNRQRKKSERNKKIVLKHLTGQSKTSIAREYGISRQQVHNIIASQGQKFP